MLYRLFLTEKYTFKNKIKAATELIIVISIIIKIKKYLLLY